MENRSLKEQHFTEQAKTILQFLNKTVRYDRKTIPRPFFMEWTGTPDAGKTTSIKGLDASLRKEGLRVFTPQEGAEAIRHVERNTPLYNIRTGLYAISLLIDLSQGHQYDIVMFDRCAFDFDSWMEYWFRKGDLSEELRLMYQTFALSEFWINNLDVVYFMTCDPTVSMKRAEEMASIKKEGGTTNPKTVANLFDIFTSRYELHSKTHPQLQLVDTTDLDKQEMTDLLTAKTLDILEAKTRTKLQ
jgi:thymidylate kinase